ncbi:hypothetical protein Avbf_13569 [Armadillidium vulgare]|nr:hypothetical protein Avbf_13569 [Armadillidium vulgare]
MQEKREISLFDLILDSGISNVFIERCNSNYCPPRDSCENTSDECSPSFCLSGPLCCFDGCRYICSSVCPPPGCTSNIDECYSTFCMTSPIGIGRCCFDGCRNVCRGIIN